MPSCCAKNCSNRNENGFRTFKYPRDAERRQIWIERSGYAKPKTHSRLCEYHFDDSAFENNRADGLRKLKPNAIPTIFTEEIISDAIVKTFEQTVEVVGTTEREINEDIDNFRFHGIEEVVNANELENINSEGFEQTETGNVGNIDNFWLHGIEEVPNANEVENINSEGFKQIEIGDVGNIDNFWLHGIEEVVNTHEVEKVSIDGFEHQEIENIQNVPQKENENSEDCRLQQTEVDESIEEEQNSNIEEFLKHYLKVIEDYPEEKNLNIEDEIAAVENVQLEEDTIPDDSRMEEIEEIENTPEEEINAVDDPLPGNSGKVFMVFETGIETTEDIALNGGLVRDGTIRQANEIKKLMNELVSCRKKNAFLSERHKILKAQVKKTTRENKRLLQKQEELKKKLKGISLSNTRCKLKIVCGEK